MTQRKDVYKNIADNLIRQLEQGTAPWQKPWSGETSMPYNASTKKRYRGGNVLSLLSEGYTDPRWMTYRQATEAGVQVRRGEKGIPIVYWKTENMVTKKDEAGNPILDKDGKPVREWESVERPSLFVSHVFNAQQIDGLPPFEPIQKYSWKPHERAEALLIASQASIVHRAQNRAFYRVTEDTIYLPLREQFPDVENYYSTALHELGHWSGHESRLDRKLRNPKGSVEYAKEELRAEIASMFMEFELGVPHHGDNHAAYVASWISVLKNDPKEIFRAAADAEKILEYVLSLDLVQKQEQTLEHAQSQTRGQEQVHVQVENLSQDNAQVQNFSQMQEQGSHQARHTTSEAMKTMHKEESMAQSQHAPEEKQAAASDIQSSEPQSMPRATVKTSAKRVYLSVPRRDNEEVKALGGRWDRQKRQWYVPASTPLESIQKWIGQSASQTATEGSHEERIYLTVPYQQRVAAKKNGARWDAEAKSWYAPSTANMELLQQWLPEAQTVQEQSPALSPYEEFAEVLHGLGFVLEDSHGVHPIMDGNTHRIATIDDKQGQRSGFYVAYLDGRPAGYAMNNRSGEEVRWKSSGIQVEQTQEEREAFQALCEARKQERLATLQAAHDATAERVARQLSKVRPALEPTPYMIEKGIRPQKGAFVGGNGTTFLPAQNVEGVLRTMQYINADGVKRFAKNGQKQGCFHAVGGTNELRVAPVLIIAEGYATAASLSEVAGIPTVAAFNAGNLVTVAAALHEKYPHKPIIIAGDDDRHLPSNPGRTKAEKAAEITGGQVIFPVFATSDEGKALTDFNDLATKSVLGIEGLKRQLHPILQKALEQKRDIEQKLRQQKTQKKNIRQSV